MYVTVKRSRHLHLHPNQTQNRNTPVRNIFAKKFLYQVHQGSSKCVIWPQDIYTLIIYHKYFMVLVY